MDDDDAPVAAGDPAATAVRAGAAQLRALPSVDRLAAELARTVLAERRAELLAGASEPADLLDRARAALGPSLRPVLNASGVVIHTNLGRAPLAMAARAAVARIAHGYCNLEFDLDGGGRGSRHDHVERLLSDLTGARAAMAVNNCAAAALLAVAATATGREVIVSRGQLVEIGGGFRIPEVIGQARARLVEVGTTNRTRLSDYQQAIGPDTAAILRVHQSNFRTLGFAEDVGVGDLCGLGLPVIDDVGAGALDETFEGEQSVRASVAAGAALITFSSDKLLGGPQAGILVGTVEAIDACRGHPLARALRIDKLSLAALVATLELHRDPLLAEREIPALRMLHADPTELRARAERLREALGQGEIVASSARVGGGALPLTALHSFAVALDAPAGATALASALRRGEPAVVARIEQGRVLLDVRTLSDAEIDAVVVVARNALR